MIEKIHTYFMKHILNVKRSTQHDMLCGELGSFPLSKTVKKRMISFWYKLTENGFNLSSILDKVFLNDSNCNNKVSGWLQHVKTILDECGLKLHSHELTVMTTFFIFFLGMRQFLRKCLEAGDIRLLT